MKSFKFENQEIIECGLDEVGRGPMFGPVVASAVILPKGLEFDFNLIKDSKKLTPKKRNEAYDYIKSVALDYSVHFYDNNEIDTKNILQTTIHAMHKCIEKLNMKVSVLLIDGTYWKPYFYKGCMTPVQYECVAGGDRTFASIAAASIIAKVERDRWIDEICMEYPVLNEYYGLSKNKGYGTKQHIEGIKKHGITKWHRQSFGLCKEYKDRVIEL